ncbi:hypothetical protein HNS38_10250 [Lentimicrobium sp. L6]|uniref:hypothetical protein n=1 Tax=Lentimicrobium sp. L6 TaxID=2735916 RepID=UPI001552B15C|nr:hypothetical protein [Lentimicrobium sp. L6]NPD85142.1 hypothetical protein [Lentimicrobium sp. L6]
MKTQQVNMSPLDIVVLLKILSLEQQTWFQKTMEEDLHISQSEISKSLARSKYAGLLDPTGKKVRRMALVEFLQYGISFVFPQRAGAITRGIPTAHSAPPLNKKIKSQEMYVWPSGKGTTKGQSIIPLYPTVPLAAIKDKKLYELLALVDAIRVGRTREKEMAIQELKIKILHGE